MITLNCLPRWSHLALLGAMALPLVAQSSQQPDVIPGLGAGRAARAQEVLEAIRSQLPEIARRHGMSEQALAALIKRDRDVWIDAAGQLLYVCEGLEVAEESVSASGEIVSGTSVPNSADAFKLHSLPGSTRVIFLDFNGHVTSGTSWNSRTGADIVSAPFDMDGNGTSWSSAELDRITRIWQRVAEDFAPFGVDVTTEDPGVEALRKTTSSDNAFGIRVVISPSSSWYGNAGGVAYLQSFQWSSDTPCFVFSDRLGPNSEKYVAEAISHEVGHTLSLSHDGKTDGTGYYQGHGDWAPIMGVGYYEPVTQWSKGEYALANNLEDDLARMPLYGAPLALDDHGNTLTAATALSGSAPLTYGVIETRADVDVFRFNTGAGTITFTAASPAPAGNLDLRVDLLSSTGTVMASSNLAGLSASLSATVASGTYYLRIDGVGTGDPLTTGYSDYGSIGEYRLSGTLVSTGTNTAPTAVASGLPTSGVAPLAVAFSSAGSADAEGSLAGYSWAFGNGVTSTAANPSYTYTEAGSYTAVLTVIDQAGLSSSASVVITVLPPANLAPTAKATVSTTSGTAPLAVNFSSSGSTDPDGAITAYHWTFGDGSTSSLPHPGKTYTAAGTFTATLTVTDDRGGTASSSLTMSVLPDPNLDADVQQYGLAADRNSAGSAARATVKVLDRLGRPAAGVTVSVQWSGLVTGVSSATTDASGIATILSKRVKKAGTITGTITSVAPTGGHTFVPALYAEPLTRSVSISR